MSMLKIKTVCIAVALLVSTVGCQRVSREAAFADIQSNVTKRLNKEVRWRSIGGSYDTDPTRSLLLKELSADDAVQIALLNNRGLQAEFENIGIARADLMQAGRLKNPRLEAAYTPPVSSGPAATASLDLAQRFLDLIMMPLRKKVAAAQFEAIKAQTTASVLRLASQTKRAFYAAQAAEQILEMRKSVVDATDASAYAAEKLRAAGNITKLDLNRERDQNDQARLDLAQAEASVIESRENLNEHMGLWGTDASIWKIGKHLPEVPATEIDVTDFEKRAIDQSIELEASRRGVEALLRERRVANITPALDSMELGVSAEREDDTIWHVGPSVSLEIPIFDQGGARRAKVRAEVRQALEKHAALAVNIRANVRATIGRLTKGREQAIFLRDQVLPRRQEIVDETQKQYNVMQIGVFQLLQAKRDQIDAGRQYIERLRDYWMARSSVELISTGFSEVKNTSSEPRPIDDSDSKD
ncbi:TolC family protein [Oscillatoria laete-virens NRMC-F 0139]|nr:TolC family protein [Oscillatoria laete-virens]MDL5054131.1 TolC family protein [Oscillatoria laete-virens NRMC-F 0139]